MSAPCLSQRAGVPRLAGAPGRAGRRAALRCAAAPAPVAAPVAEDAWLAKNVVPLLEGASAPGPLAGLRGACAPALAGLRMPSTRSEEYRYTDISPLLAAGLAAAPADAPVDAALLEALALPEAAGSTAVLVNGALRPELSDLSALPAGAYVGGAAGAPAEALALLGAQSGARGGPFAVINGVLARDALVLSLPAGAALAQPLHVLHVSTAAPVGGNGGGPTLAASAPRLLVSLGAGASAELVEEHVSAGSSGAHAAVCVAEVALGEGAALRHGYAARDAAGGCHFKSTLVTQAEGSSYSLVEARIGGSLSRHDLSIAQSGPDTVTSLRHFLLAGAGQLQDLHSKLVLDHPRGQAEQLHKCIASAASGRGVFDGNVKVNRLAQKTDAGQLSRNLLLVPKATVNVKPNLQIIADDVKCTHGCTVSDLSAEELFYFRARGVSYDQARTALVYSFGAEVVQELRHERLVARIQADVQASLAAAVAEMEWTEDGQLWVQYVSSTPATRLDVISLQERLDQQLQQRQARETGICPVREGLYAQCLDELIRQVTVNCAERGLLLLRVRDEMRMTIAAYQTLYESSIAFGMRKALLTEAGKGELEAQVVQMEGSIKDLERQARRAAPRGRRARARAGWGDAPCATGRAAAELGGPARHAVSHAPPWPQVAEWKLKCEAIEKREAERRESEAKKHKEEVAYLESYAKQLKGQIEAFVTPPKKGAAASAGGGQAVLSAA
ncbi:IDA4 [Scenedesmus sp. PABB004]|nr:IDA4 [Scenedesmus sp. PABB004]